MAEAFGNSTVHIEMSITHTDHNGDVIQVARTASYDIGGDNPRFIRADVDRSALRFGNEVIPGIIDGFPGSISAYGPVKEGLGRYKDHSEDGNIPASDG